MWVLNSHHNLSRQPHTYPQHIPHFQNLFAHSVSRKVYGVYGWCMTCGGTVAVQLMLLFVQVFRRLGLQPNSLFNLSAWKIHAAVESMLKKHYSSSSTLTCVAIYYSGLVCYSANVARTYVCLCNLMIGVCLSLSATSLCLAHSSLAPAHPVDQSGHGHEDCLLGTDLEDCSIDSLRILVGSTQCTQLNVFTHSLT